MKTAQNLAADLEGEAAGRAAEKKGPEAVRLSYADLLELGNQAQQYLSLRQAAVRARLFNLALKSSIGLAAGAIALAVLGASGVMIVTGTRRLLDHFLGAQAFAASFLTGVFYTSLIIGGGYFWIRLIEKKRARGVIMKYRKSAPR